MNIVTWIHDNWEAVAALAGALHVVLNVLGKLFKNPAIEGLDNTFMSVLSVAGIKPGANDPKK